MSESPSRRIGVSWIVAIAALLVLLLIGIVLYMKMSTPLRQAPAKSARFTSGRHHSLCTSPAICGRYWV